LHEIALAEPLTRRHFAIGNDKRMPVFASSLAPRSFSTTSLEIMSMNEPWPQIVDRFEQCGGNSACTQAMRALSKRIANSTLACGLFAWTSMFDLCIAQTAVTYPYDGPYLRVSPLPTGQIEFRYLDTHELANQWHRTVEPEEAVSRLLKFLDQLRWFPPEALRDDL